MRCYATFFNFFLFSNERPVFFYFFVFVFPRFLCFFLPPPLPTLLFCLRLVTKLGTPDESSFGNRENNKQTDRHTLVFKNIINKLCFSFVLPWGTASLHTVTRTHTHTHTSSIGCYPLFGCCVGVCCISSQPLCLCVASLSPSLSLPSPLSTLLTTTHTHETEPN